MLIFASLCLCIFVLITIKPVSASEEMDYELEQILFKLESEEPELRCEVADYLSYCGHPRAFEVLLGILKDEDWAVRIAAVKAFGEMGDQEAVKHVSTLLNDGYWHVRKEVVKTIGMLGGKDAIHPLMYLLNSNDDLLKGSAQKALIKVGNTAIEGMLSKKTDERWQAAKTLGLLRDKRPLPLLTEAIKIEQDDNVRAAIEEAIMLLTSDVPVEPPTHFMPPQQEAPPGVVPGTASVPTGHPSSPGIRPGVVSAQEVPTGHPTQPGVAPGVVYPSAGSYEQGQGEVPRHIPAGYIPPPVTGEVPGGYLPTEVPPGEVPAAYVPPGEVPDGYVPADVPTGEAGYLPPGEVPAGYTVSHGLTQEELLAQGGSASPGIEDVTNFPGELPSQTASSMEGSPPRETVVPSKDVSKAASSGNYEDVNEEDIASLTKDTELQLELEAFLASLDDD